LYKEPYSSYNFRNGFAGKNEVIRSNSSPKDSNLPAKFFIGKKSMQNLVVPGLIPLSGSHTKEQLKTLGQPSIKN
tara:strand:- start:131 stop:355 length:225 start_codon:yes stop_codon:yes gene_type:complete